MTSSGRKFRTVTHNPGSRRYFLGCLAGDEVRALSFYEMAPQYFLVGGYIHCASSGLVLSELDAVVRTAFKGRHKKSSECESHSECDEYFVFGRDYHLLSGRWVASWMGGSFWARVLGEVLKR